MIIKKQETGKDRNSLHCEGQILEEVSTFEYLGSVIINDGKIIEDVASKQRKSTNI